MEGGGRHDDSIGEGPEARLATFGTALFHLLPLCSQAPGVTFALRPLALGTSRP